MSLSAVRKYLRRVLADDSGGASGTDLEFAQLVNDEAIVSLEPLNVERANWETVLCPELAGALAQGETYEALCERLGVSDQARVPSVPLDAGNAYLVDATLHARLGRAYAATAVSMDDSSTEFIIRAQRTLLIESPPDAALGAELARAHWRLVVRVGSPMAERLEQVFASAKLAPLDQDDPYGDALDIYPIPGALVYFLCSPAAGADPAASGGVPAIAGEWRSLPLWAYIAAAKN